MKQLMLVLALLVFGCNGTGPPPIDPPPEVCEAEKTTWPECENSGGLWSPDEDEPACNCECPDGGVFIEDRGCESIPPPPVAKSCATPVGERIREDYIPLERTDYWQGQLQVYDSRLVNNGIRNPAFALRHCAADTPNSVWPYNGIGDAEAGNTIDLSGESKHALTGADGESGFYERVAQVNRRCPSFPDLPAIIVDATDPWCGRSNVYRPCFNEYWRLALWLTDGCSDPEGGTLEECTAFNPSSQPTGPVSRLDGVKGACQEKLDE